MPENICPRSHPDPVRPAQKALAKRSALDFDFDLDFDFGRNPPPGVQRLTQ
jgi:hypothetical protein